MSTHRYDGCTLTGALSVTTQVTDGVTIIHGPAGCAHHNFSLLHASLQEHESPFLPRILSSQLDEGGIIFGGEEMLEKTIRAAFAIDPQSIFVVSTCITDTIGDDVGAVCAAEWDVPVIHIPTSGFFKGAFHHGLLQALQALAALAIPSGPDARRTVNLIGEKNLEYEVEENYLEVKRLLSLLGLEIRIRYVRDLDTRGIMRLGEGGLNILREPRLEPVGKALARRFGTPYVPTFPVGLSGSLEFLERVGGFFGVDSTRSIEQEHALQDEILTDFADLKGERISINQESPLLEVEPACLSLVHEIIARLSMRLDGEAPPLPLPVSAPVGTAGVRRLLHRWRRAIDA